MKDVKYDKEFKLNSIKHYRESQQPIVQVYRNLGIPISTFSSWLKEFNENGEESFYLFKDKKSMEEND